MNLLTGGKYRYFEIVLASRLGLNEAIVLNQIRFWLIEVGSGVEHNGKRWIYNTYDKWREQFPFWSKDTVKRTLNSLYKQGVIEICQVNAARRDMTNFYTIVYSHPMLHIADHDVIDPSKLTPSMDATCTDVDGCNLPSSKSATCPDVLTEITTDITTEKTAHISPRNSRARRAQTASQLLIELGEKKAREGQAQAEIDASTGKQIQPFSSSNSNAYSEAGKAALATRTDSSQMPTKSASRSKRAAEVGKPAKKALSARKRKGEVDLDMAVIPDWLDRKKVEEFIDERRLRGGPVMTDRAFVQFINRLTSLRDEGWDVHAAIDYTIEIGTLKVCADFSKRAPGASPQQTPGHSKRFNSGVGQNRQSPHDQWAEINRSREMRDQQDYFAGEVINVESHRVD